MSSKQYYTASGTKIRNPDAYAATGAPMFENFTTKTGKKVYNPESYVNSGGELYYDKDINEERSIYEVKCRGGKRYVGETGDIDRRLTQHFSGKGSQVTKKYGALSAKEVEKVPGFFAKEVEQEHTEKLIRRHGYDNVRGGRYTNSNTLGRRGRRNYTYYDDSDDSDDSDGESSE